MKIRTFVELCRASNLPTAWTNVLVGYALGGGGNPAALTWLLAGTSLLYCAGMILNDWADADRDRELAPERPIPSGRVTPGQAAFAALIVGVLGVACLLVPAPAAAAPWTLGLVGAIVAYDLLHARLSSSVVLMGACRGFVYLLVAAAVAGDVVPSVPGVVIAGTMVAYITLLTAIARAEHGGRVRMGYGAGVLLALVVLVPAAVVRVDTAAFGFGALAAAVLAAAWLVASARHLRAAPPRIGAAVMGWLAGICLVDAWWLLLLDDRIGAAVAAACFIFTRLGHRRISGT